jgi:hypothetical protein
VYRWRSRCDKRRFDAAGARNL